MFTAAEEVAFFDFLGGDDVEVDGVVVCKGLLGRTDQEFTDESQTSFRVRRVLLTVSAGKVPHIPDGCESRLKVAGVPYRVEHIARAQRSGSVDVLTLAPLREC